MNLKDYILNRQKFESQLPQYRSLCSNCLQSQKTCFCHDVQKFNPQIKFVILIHPLEAKRKIATGRMAHLCLEQSELIKGEDYSFNDRVNEILDDPQNQSYILYPGIHSSNISDSSEQLFRPGKIPVIFVIDGTWATARKTMRLSQNLRSVPRICFTPTRPSRFRIRKQPRQDCYSTIEAIHQSIELIGNEVNFDTANRKHDALIHIFDKMVEKHIEFIRNSQIDPLSRSFRIPRFNLDYAK